MSTKRKDRKRTKRFETEIEQIEREKKRFE
jgi:hypothetical protein